MSLGARETETETEGDAGWMDARATTVRTGKRAIYLATAVVERALGERCARVRRVSRPCTSGRGVRAVGERKRGPGREDGFDARDSENFWGPGRLMVRTPTAAAMIGKTLDVPVGWKIGVRDVARGCICWSLRRTGANGRWVAAARHGRVKTALRKGADAPGRGCHLVTADVRERTRRRTSA